MSGPKDDELRGYTVQEVVAQLLREHRRSDAYAAECACGWAWEWSDYNFRHSDHVAATLRAAGLLA